MEIEGQRLNLSKKIYQKGIWKSIESVANGEYLTAPLMVEIDPTSACDFSCPECVSHDLLNQTKFSSQRLIELAHEVVSLGIRAVIFVGGGEPMVHPAIGEAIEILGKANIKIGIITNGSQLHKYVDVLCKYTEWVRVSVDAGTPLTFEQFRPHRSNKNVFSNIIDNMRLLKQNHIKCLGYSFLLMTRWDENNVITHSNYDELYDAGVLAKDIGCDYFEIKPLFDPITHVIYSQSEGLLQNLASQINNLKQIESSTFKVIYPQALVELVTQQNMAKIEPYGKCWISELRTLITPHGVYICPLYRGKQDYSFGNLQDKSLKEIWGGEKRKELINKINPCKDCLPKCSRHLSNMEFPKIAQGKINHEIVDDFDYFI